MTKEIPVYGGLVALVDDEDEALVWQYKWHQKRERHTVYARAKLPGQHGEAIWMHRLILGAPQGLEVDHANQNGLDNRRSNIRLCTKSQNNQNRCKYRTGHTSPGAVPTSQFKGVFFHRASQLWVSQAYQNGKRVQVGYFHSERDAAEAYDRTASLLYGPFARLNFPVTL